MWCPARPARVGRSPPTRPTGTSPTIRTARKFATVGEIFTANPDRKKAFEIRTVMAAVTDADHPRTERWAGMADAETAVVMDARIGGHSICLVGIESAGAPGPASVDFGVAAIRRGIERAARAAGCHGLLTLRRRPDGHVFVTDQGHVILDAAYGVIRDPVALAAGLAEVPGVVEHGLFIIWQAASFSRAADGVTVITEQLEYQGKSSRIQRNFCST